MNDSKKISTEQPSDRAEISFLWEAMSLAQDRSRENTERFQKTEEEASGLRHRINVLENILAEKNAAEPVIPVENRELMFRIKELAAEIETRKKVIADKEILIDQQANEIKRLISALGEEKLANAGTADTLKMQEIGISDLKNTIADLKRQTASVKHKESMFQEAIEKRGNEAEKISRSALELSTELDRAREL